MGDPFLLRLKRPMLTGLLVLASASGCGSGRPSVDTSTSEGTVRGTVKVRGKPVTAGKISFDPSNVARKSEPARTAPIGSDGSYTVKTLIGLNQVTFSGPAFNKERELQDASLRYEVQRGEATYNIVLPEAAAP